MHRCHFTLAARHHVDHLRGELFRHVDGQFFDRLALLSVNLLVDNLRLAHLQFVTFAAHRFDEDGEVKHAAAANNPRVARLVALHTQGEVLFEFLFEAVVDVARGAELTLFAEER